MVDRVRSVDFLPEIFQTPVNKQFLAATLDQLIQEPKFKKTQGYVGRKIGPGVNPTDRYVIEPTVDRNEYQLEPGVVAVDPADSTKIIDTITYPGINDALALQGATVTDADRLYTSEYYSWDPFCDFDKFVNFSQYYWLPAGPLAVDVFATTIPTTDTFTVTRANGVYTFSGVSGNNPTLTLVRGGNYQFVVAQNNKETVNFRVTNNNIASYQIDYQPNPTLKLVRGNTYVFNLNLDRPLPFYIKTQASLGNNNTYDSGVLRNGATTGIVTFTVPQDAPNTLYYSCSTEFNLRGQLDIVDAMPGSGPGFWIQTDPSVYDPATGTLKGVLPYAPNISSRDVLGVTNNGEDLGTVGFDVPYSTAQNFYYSLTQIASVDFITNLNFNQINNQPVESFITTYGGIDGITSLNGRTLVFQQTNAGWEITVIGDTFDSMFDSSTPIDDPAVRYSVWRIEYVTIDGVEYIQLNSILPVNELEKFSILFGTEYASTQWYKNAEGYFSEIPLLTAVKNILYYQDGTDPEIFGQIRLIDQIDNATIDIDEIIGRPNYTSPNGVVFSNGMKVNFIGNVVPSTYAGNQYYVEGVGTAIRLLPVSSFVTPETYTQSSSVPYDSTPYDVGNFDSTLNAPAIPDYLTINRASPDLNPWTRSNRWFHIDVINASAAYNNTEIIVDNAQRARRPIIEFRAGTKLFDFGTEGIQPVDVIDFAATDALSTINGTIGYGIDGYQFIAGTRVIFAADTDPAVRNQVYVVEFVTPDSVPPLIAQPVINLVPASSVAVKVDQTVVCLSGETLQGKSFYFDGVEWLSTQQKTKTNQAPLFDVYDADGVSFSNNLKYPSSTFTGSKLFSYAVNLAGTNDVVLGFPLQYLSLTNVGDIVFDNNLYADTFVYAPGSVGTTEYISKGFVRQYSDRVTFVKEIGWQTGITPSRSRQQFRFVYDGTPLLLDVRVNDSTVVPAVQLYVNSAFQESSAYSVTTTADTTTIVLNNTYVPGDVIEVAVLSDQISSAAFYQVPVNLENNPLNGNSKSFTLGTIRNHYGTICENLINISGPINGANNTRDLGNLIPYGQQILQQSSPLTLAGYFMREAEFNIFAALDYNSREYIKFKSKLLETVVNNDYDNMTTAEILDSAIADITLGRTNLNPFYWSDMLPTGSVYTQTVTTVSAITTNTFNTVQTYNFTTANYLGLLVYLTRAGVTTLLERDLEYRVSTDSPRLTIEITLNVGDVVTIREYSDTAGNFVPNTPSKMGLYPKYRPEIIYDTNYVTPTPVIVGHDGSITVAFGDLRDEVLLEFEKRVYNNIKMDGNPVPLTYEDVAPGFFRTTDYSQTEINDILSANFLSWLGWNKLNYKAQDYIPGNEFTYNYSQSGNKINEQPLLGAWRGIYRWFYDTTSPNTTPWEMLGLSEEPTWWQDRYGPAPYTADNLVLWDDLELGLVADPIAPYIRPQYARPGLTKVIPTGSEGQLLSPLESVIGLYDPTSFQKSWAIGDGGPVEAAWWTSSSYPYAVMRLLALTRPAEFFALFADRDLYRYNFELGQYLYNDRYRLDANGIEIYGDANRDGTGVSKASYINWIVDYNQQLGLNSTAALTDALKNLDVRLCYRMASFTQEQNLEIFLERSGPNSTNSSLRLPPESFQLQLYKNQPFSKISYSSLIVERVDEGYTVYGYSTVNPYFEIFASASNGILQTITSGGATVRVPAEYTNTIVQIPYGYTFVNTTVVVDFILSYGKFLESQGLIFDDVENGFTLNWNQMAQEFLYFSQQGWAPGTMINLNPVATKIKAYKAGAIVDTIVSITPENMLLDQNRAVLPTRDLVVTRLNNDFTVSSLSGQTISFLEVKFTSYEDILILDNVSIFSDLVYDPVTAARQNRIRVSAYTSTDWNGQLDAQGFIENNPDVKQWVPNKKYTKGEIVIYKNNYWSALTIIQPKLEFDYADWVKSNYNLIQEGLLPNIANKADQLANSYDIYKANLNSDNDLLSYGLIGFRPRQYMSDLNLDDVTQVQLYQQFLGTKGTVRAAEIFTRADLGKETGAYDIYENWGVLVGTYGANANRSFFEVVLNEANLQSDPATIQIIQPQQFSQADQTVQVNNIWKSSYKITTPDILPTTYPTLTDTALPTAGYVNIDDVDITVFDINDPTNIGIKINEIGIGTTIWVAKINSYQWDIYRIANNPSTMFQLQDNLNGTSIAYTQKAHNLKIGDLVIIRFFADAIDGVFRVLGVPSITSFTIAYSFTNTNQSSITGTGLVFSLESKRVYQPSDIASLSYAKALVPGARVWVDNDSEGHWEVLEKQDVFSSTTELLPIPLVPNSLYGTSVTQSQNYFSALVGAPLNDEGIVQSYRRDENTNYVPNIQLLLNAPNVAEFGYSVDFGNTIWAAAGAPGSDNDAGYVVMLYLIPGSNDYNETQLLNAPDQNFGPTRFGSAVSISTDERWMYVSAPVANRVYAYNRVEVENQEVTYLADGLQRIFNYSNNIQIDSANPQQLLVTVNGQIKTYGVDYTVSASDVTFFATPVAEQLIKISRKQATILDQFDYYSIQQSSTTGIGTGATFTVTVTRGVYSVSLVLGGLSYIVGEVLTILGTEIGGTTPADDLTITINSVGPGGVIESFTPAGSGNSSTTTFELSTYLYTATNIYSFAVLVDGEFQRPHIDYEFNEDSSGATQDLTFLTVPPAGATITVLADSYWQYVTTITLPTLPPNAQFGASVNTALNGRQVVIGAPNDIAGSVDRAGSAYVFDRSVVAYQITDTAVTTYAIPGSYNEPIAVLLNNQYLTNTDQFINGQFTVIGSNVVLSSNVTLTVGDILEIETNEFQLLEKLINEIPQAFDSYGAAVKLSHRGTNVFVGAPLDTNVLTQDGGVYAYIDQAREYGVITSTIANPTLDNGDTIRINNFEVAVPNSPNQNIAGLVAAINAANIPNVVATLTSDLTFDGNGIIKIFNIGNLYSVAESYTPVVYVDNTLQTLNVDYSYNNTTEQIIFVTAPSSGTVITVVSGRMTVSVKNYNATVAGNRLTVLPGLIGSTFNDIGFKIYPLVQEIVSPNPAYYGQFGNSIDIDTDDINLVIGSPNGNIIAPVTFDNGLTVFDSYSTQFFSPIDNSGVVYTYNYLPSVSPSVNNPGQFVFGQQVYDFNALKTGDRFGYAVNYTSGRMIAGAPGNDATYAAGNFGATFVFDNPTNKPAWATIRAQQPAVDVNLLNSVFTYDKLESRVTQYFDFIDPLQGKILGAARRNIDYIGAVDPAQYNNGSVHNNGNSWASEHLGEMWWDTDRVRFIDPSQDNLTYASRRWAQTFPGSSVDIYQWISSTVPPSQYAGPGTPLSTVSYSINTGLNKQNIFETTYYFWVRGITTIETGAGKTLSTTGVASYIENPKGSGIPYLAPLSSSAVAIYNALDLISAQDTILHIGYDRKATDDDIHQEFQFVADGRADSFLNATLYRKLQDSFCGVDVNGALVPDPTLGPADRYGVQFRPRQSMFADRYTALKNYLVRVNGILAQYPIVEIRNFSLLNSSEPIPSTASGAWNKEVATLEELGYQNLDIVPVGYKYLVLSDTSQNGLWTIYEVINGPSVGTKALQLIRIQNYDTRLYWKHIDWYRVGYNSTIQPLAQVPNYSALNTLSLTTVPVGGSAKVTANSQGKFEIYLRTATGWERVGLQDGTIAFKEELWNYTVGGFGFDVEVFDSQYFDQEPVIETRKIIQAINEELLVDELLIERNQCLILMFNFVYSEFTAPEWLVKTSLIDVSHNIRALLPFQVYQQDNQTFVLDYIQEVKPYHVQVREFNLAYSGQDSYDGNLTDFDVPAYWNSTLEIPQYVSPVLLPYTRSSSVVQSNISDTDSNAEIWMAWPWTQWYNNYLLSIQGVTIVDGGFDYSDVPTVTVTGDCITPAVMEAVINSAGQVVAINIINPGAGYSTTAIITITGGNGAGARAVAQMGNDLVRSIKTTLKYDRYEYTSNIVDWQANVTYTQGTQVRYIDRVWSANSTVNTSEFILTDWTEVAAADLSGVNRTQGYYVPAVNEPGLDLPLLIDGLDYPGVQVAGPLFSQNTGFDVGNFDINPFDNISYGPEGLPTYDPAILDAIYESSYLDIYLGTRPTDINVDGGAYVDTYESHAPEELVPGIEFDTLDLRVYTNPGADWENDGHGFPEEDHSYIYDPLNPTISFHDNTTVLPYPVSLEIVNQTQRLTLTYGVDYTVDWVNETVTIIDSALPGDILQITTFELGGGNQLYKNTYNGADVGNTLIIPVQYSLIQELAIFVNGVYLPVQLNDSTENYVYAAYTSTSTEITFTNTYTFTDDVTVYVIGPTVVGSTTYNYSWSTPQTQVIAGVTGQTIYTLTNSMQYVNPDNAFVTVNGVRARTSAGAMYYADGSSEYALPQRLGFSQSLIADNEVRVYVNNIQQVLGVDYFVEPYSPYDDFRSVIFAVEPTVGEQILVCVTTNAQCVITGNQLVFNIGSGLVPSTGDVIAVTSWNDTRQQNLLTQVYVGPTTTGVVVTENYDETDFDEGNITGDPGSYDYSAGITVSVNNLQLGRIVTDPTRLWVTLNGDRLLYGSGYTVSGTELILNSGILGVTDVVMITQFTDSVVPEAMAFRIFQDMRGVQATYRITPATTTTLAQNLASTDDIIYVTNASALSEPNVAYNIWGVLTIDGERIMYRERDTVNNTISSLLRGTAGTAAADHSTDALVYDMGRGNLLPVQYQNYIVNTSVLADGVTTNFVADNITVSDVDSTTLDEAVEVYVGGILQTSGYMITGDAPVTVLFSEAPADGSEVTILVRRGINWYNPGVNTPSNGMALQVTDNQIARFLRGQ